MISDLSGSRQESRESKVFRVRVCVRARVRAIGSVDSDVWTRAGDPTGPNGERGGGTHPRGLMTILAIPYRSNARLRLFVCIMIICS